MQAATPSNMRTAARQLWGDVQKQRTLAPGVVAVDTAGHGGIIVDTFRFPLDPRIAEGLFTNPVRWTYSATGETAIEVVGFEEDADWAALIFCHPQLLQPAIRKGYLSDHVTPEYVAERIAKDDYYERLR